MPLIVYCTAALASLSDSVSYITFLFSEWRIPSLSNNSRNFCFIDSPELYIYLLLFLT